MVLFLNTRGEMGDGGSDGGVGVRGTKTSGGGLGGGDPATAMSDSAGDAGGVRKKTGGFGFGSGDGGEMSSRGGGDVGGV